MVVFERQRIKKAVLPAVLAVLGLVIIWARCFFGAMETYQEGEIHLKGEQYVTAITFFDRSLRWYTPFNPYVEKSAERLWEIGLAAEERGDVRLALMAFTTIRRGFFAARSIDTPGEDWITRCDVRISRLAPPADHRQSGQSESRDPLLVWTILLEIGLLGWIGSTIGFILFACSGDRQVRLERAPALVWGSLALISYAVWLVGMMKA